MVSDIGLSGSWRPLKIARFFRLRRLIHCWMVSTGMRSRWKTPDRIFRSFDGSGTCGASSWPHQSSALCQLSIISDLREHFHRQQTPIECRPEPPSASRPDAHAGSRRCDASNWYSDPTTPKPAISRRPRFTKINRPVHPVSKSRHCCALTVDASSYVHLLKRAFIASRFGNRLRWPRSSHLIAAIPAFRNSSQYMALGPGA